MSSAADLYQRVVIDHNREPRNFRPVDPNTHHALGHNPLCGDRVELFLDVRDGIIRDIGFQGDACAIATASASLLTERLLGHGVDEARSLTARFETALAEGEDADADLGEAAALLAVRRYPGREKCARLPWRTLKAALDGDTARSVSTETST